MGHLDECKRRDTTYDRSVLLQAAKKLVQAASETRLRRVHHVGAVNPTNGPSGLHKILQVHDWRCCGALKCAKFVDKVHFTPVRPAPVAGDAAAVSLGKADSATHGSARGRALALRGDQGARRAAKTENRPRVANGPPGAETSIPTWGHHVASAGGPCVDTAKDWPL